MKRAFLRASRRTVLSAANRVGIQISRYPQNEVLWRVAQLLENNGIDLVLDVGANDGGYGSSIRRFGYRGEILSFEPVSGAYERLSRRVGRDPLWTAVRSAVGSEGGTATINIAGNAEASSSILPMLDRHVVAAPDAAYIGEETVSMVRLDESPNVRAAMGGRRAFLKIDVQGYEKQVLDGAKGVLDANGVVGVQMELSLVPLYESAWTWIDGIEWAQREGMTCVALEPGFWDPRSGQLLQFDAVFLREDHMSRIDQ